MKCIAADHYAGHILSNISQYAKSYHAQSGYRTASPGTIVLTAAVVLAALIALERLETWNR